MKFEIKSRWDGRVLFSAEAGSFRLAVEAAVQSRANLAGADLAGADLARAYLAGADLADANLARANLAGANLARANLAGADLARADLAGAYLAGADLARANLARANLARANLARANLARAKGINKNLCTPLRILLDQPGLIRAYKLVQADGASPMAACNGFAPITYEMGKSYAVDDACTDEETHCAAGISLATLDWCMREWRKTYRIFIAEFTAADIAAIPTATDGKFRVHRCRIVGEKDLAEIGLLPANDKEQEDKP